MPVLTISGTEITYTVTKSNRRSVSMSFKSSEEIEVRAPKFMPEFLIKQFIKKNEEWILKHITKRKLQKEKSYFPEFKHGEQIPFFGERYPLTIATSEMAKTARLYFVNKSFQLIRHPTLTEKQTHKETKKLFKDWYMRNIKPKLEERIQHWARIMNATYNQVRIKDVKGHWGSCSSKKNLNFNYRLAMLPMEGIDYVIIHELSHLIEMNHSLRFWKIVEKYMPEYKEVRKRLKEQHIEVE